MTEWIKDLIDIDFEGVAFKQRKYFAYLVQAANEKDAQLEGYPKDANQSSKADYFVLTYKDKVQ